MSTRVPLPPGTTLGKSFEYGVDVDLAAPGATEPDWQPVRRMNDFTDTPTPQTTDSQTYDDVGSANDSVTGWDWAIGLSTLVNRLTSGLYLPEIEALLARTRPDALDEKAQIRVRWYHKPLTGTPNPNDAFEGLARVARTRANTGADGASEKLNWTLTGVGPATQIENPFEGWDEDGTP